MRELEAEITKRSVELLELHAARLSACGLRWEPPEIEVWDADPVRYTAEFSVWIWSGRIVRAVLEFYVFRHGRPMITADEAVHWIDEQIQSLEKDP